MRIDGSIPYSWDKVNEAIREMLQVPYNVQAYKSTSHAIFEVCIGLHLRFMHKRRIVGQFGFGSHLRSVELEMAKQGVRFKPEIGDDPEKDLKQTLAFVFDADDALTGEIYDRSSILAQLDGKPIFRVHILHHLFYYRPEILKNLGEYDIVICSLTKDMAIAVLGDKCSLPNLSSGELYWGDYHVERAKNCIAAKYIENKDKVLSFESELPPEAVSWFDAGHSQRIFDRALFHLLEMDGGAFVDLYSELFGLPATEPGDFCKLESASFSRWKNRLWLEQAEALGRTPEQLRGLVSVDCEFLTEEFKLNLKTTIAKLKELSH